LIEGPACHDAGHCQNRKEDDGALDAGKGDEPGLPEPARAVYVRRFVLFRVDARDGGKIDDRAETRPLDQPRNIQHGAEVFGVGVDLGHGAAEIIDDFRDRAVNGGQQAENDGT
jgi:hypothetical protein